MIIIDSNWNTKKLIEYFNIDEGNNPIEIFLFCYVIVIFYDKMGKKKNLIKIEFFA